MCKRSLLAGHCLLINGHVLLSSSHMSMKHARQPYTVRTSIVVLATSEAQWLWLAIHIARPLPSVYLTNGELAFVRKATANELHVLSEVPPHPRCPIYLSSPQRGRGPLHIGKSIDACASAVRDIWR